MMPVGDGLYVEYQQGLRLHGHLFISLHMRATVYGNKTGDQYEAMEVV